MVFKKKEVEIECFDYPFGYLLRCLIEFASFICICVIVGLSRKNPFEKHIIGNLTDYFSDVIDTNTSNPISNVSIYNNSILINDKKNKNIFNESSNDYSYDDDIEDIKKMKNFGKLRKLVSESFCLEIRENFQTFKGKKLSTIFDLKYSKIHKFAIAEMVISCVMFFTLMLGGCLKKELNCFAVLSFISFILIIPRFVLSFLLFYYMEKSDIERYDDFLDCKKVRVKTFKNIAGISKLRNCFYTFVVFNVIILGIEKIERLCDYYDKTEENIKRRLGYN